MSNRVHIYYKKLQYQANDRTPTHTHHSSMGVGAVLDPSFLYITKSYAEMAPPQGSRILLMFTHGAFMFSTNHESNDCMVVVKPSTWNR
jgi:hypothetical protein